MPETSADHVDVLIVGAGISGICAAYRISQENPGITYRVLERRSRIGGTWDLFRYPGVRSDSDIFSLSYPFEPWQGDETVADGEDIRAYVENTALRYGITPHIRFDTLVHAADWDSSTDTWTVRATAHGEPVTYTAGFVFFASGYYNYDQPYEAHIPGIGEFAGDTVHPQFWPEDLDYAGRNIVVIGSGATAMSLVPALAKTAATVTMLQRSPTYVVPADRVRKATKVARALLPARAAHSVLRRWNAAQYYYFGKMCAIAPKMMRNTIRKANAELLPDDFDIDVHFNPAYNPWDQRVCLIADGDLFAAITDKRVEVVTDHIDHVDAAGISLKSGARIDADVIVTATGLNLQALGGVTVSLDGADIKPHDRFAYKAHLLEDVPNLAWCIGYTNASWTLRADITARATAALISYMRENGYTHAYPHRGPEPMPEKHAWDLQAGYVLRAPEALPKSGTKRPWNIRQDWVLDALDHRFDRITESMVFGCSPTRASYIG